MIDRLLCRLLGHRLRHSPSHLVYWCSRAGCDYEWELD